MKTKQPYRGFMAALSLWLALAMVLGGFRPVQAGMEDTAMFYEELSQYGQWVDYENYGPVWIPSKVQENWRPYTDGRWVPSEQGYIFETQEPWGWATYHYGNWMPTPNYGWVWVPGRTWYPATVDWRTSPESTPAEEAYIGWAPIPPPNYVPPPIPAYEPSGGYYPGSPVTDLITAPFYVFAQAASFLLGLGQAYTPSYSYVNVGVLAPPAYVPVFFPQTMLVANYLTPTYYPGVAFIGPGATAFTAFNGGPPVAYVSRVTNISQTVINQNITNNTVNITNINNVVAPGAVLNQNIALRNITPPALVQGRRLPPPHPVKDVQLAAANLGKPNMVKPPKDIPPIKGEIPKAPKVPPSAIKGTPGTGLPAKATQPLTPKMAQQIEKLPPGQKIVPAKPLKPPVAGVKPPAPGEKPAVPGVKPAAPGEKPPTVGVKPPAPGEKPPAPGVKPPAPGAKPTTPVVKPPTKPGEPPTGYKPPTTGPGLVKPGEKPATPTYKATTPGEKPPTPGVKPATPAAKPPTPATPSQQQQQLQQQKQREQQLQQQRQREQQSQQQRQREQQQQQQKQREQQQRQQQLQQQQQQQQQRQREQQLQQQRQQQQQQQQQKQKEKEAREKAERERQQREQQQQQQQQQQREQQQRQQQQRYR